MNIEQEVTSQSALSEDSEISRFNAEMGRRLRVRRELLRLSYGALALKAGIEAQKIEAYENGTAMMPAASVFSFVKALNVDLTYFWGKTPEARSSMQIRDGAARFVVIQGGV